MKHIQYNTLQELESVALVNGWELYETNTSWSHSIFENKTRTELHIYQK